MEPKKTKRADVDRQNGGIFGNFFLIGLVVAIGLVCIAFQWRSYEEIKEKKPIKVKVPEESQIAKVTKQQKKQESTPSAPPKINMVPDRPAIDKGKPNAPKAPTIKDGPPSLADYDGEKIKNEPKIFKFVEKEPKYPGGRSELFRYLRNVTEYPTSAKEAGIEGTVIVNFVVNKDGSITDVQIGRGVSEKLNKEALRVVKNMPKWQPGKQRGKPVRVRYRVPIRFSLN
jgi:protein TonB